MLSAENDVYVATSPHSKAPTGLKSQHPNVKQILEANCTAATQGRFRAIPFQTNKETPEGAILHGSEPFTLYHADLDAVLVVRLSYSTPFVSYP